MGIVTVEECALLPTLNDKEREELEYLQFFFCECDFGPAHEDVVYIINRRFCNETGRQLPEGYADE